MIRASLIVLVACAIPRVSSAQGLFLQKGTSGYGADLGFSTDGGSVTLGAHAGYSYQGWVDVSVLLHQTYLDPDKTSGYELKQRGITPRLAVHPLKQSDTMPLSVAVTGRLGTFSIAGEGFDDSGMSMVGWTAGASTTVYRFFKLGANYGVIPGVELAYGHSESTLESPYGTTQASDELFTVAIGGHGAWLHDSGYIFTLTPTVTIDHHGTPSFSLIVGAIRPRQ
jgi:hypothetical protein